jgi:hypothetical protein
MKFRTDFVTNSSASAFTIVKVNLKNGKELKYLGESGQVEGDTLLDLIKSGANPKTIALDIIYGDQEVWEALMDTEFYDEEPEDEIAALNEFDVDSLDLDENRAFYDAFIANVKSLSEIKTIESEYIDTGYGDEINEDEVEAVGLNNEELPAGIAIESSTTTYLDIVDMNAQTAKREEEVSVNLSNGDTYYRITKADGSVEKGVRKGV